MASDDGAGGCELLPDFVCRGPWNRFPRKRNARVRGGSLRFFSVGILLNQRTSNSDEAPRLVGDRVAGDKYQIVTVLPRGRVGALYEVTLSAGWIDGRFALRELPVTSGDLEARDKLLSHLRRLAQLVDETLVPIRDVGVTASGRIYYTMDFCEFPLLSRLLREGAPLSVGDSLAIVRRVLRGLSRAHDCGVLHRGLTPSEVFVDLALPHGARIADTGVIGSILEFDPTLVTPAAAVYLAPEQCTEQPVTAATDLYATGVLLYQCLTGRVPYPGQSLQQVQASWGESPPLLPAPARFLTPVLLRAIDPDAKNRFQNAAEFLAALRRVEQSIQDGVTATERLGETTHPRVSRTKHQVQRLQSRGIWIVIVALMAIALGIVTVFLLTDRPAPRAQRSTRQQPAEPAPVTARPNPAGAWGETPSQRNPRATETEALELLAAADDAELRGDWKTLIVRARRLREFSESRAVAARFLGRAHFELGHMTRAAVYLSEATSQAAGATPELLWTLALAHSRIDPPNWNSVEAAVRALLKQQVMQPNHALLLGRALLEQGAMGAFRELVAAAEAVPLSRPVIERLQKLLVRTDGAAQ